MNSSALLATPTSTSATFKLPQAQKPRLHSSAHRPLNQSVPQIVQTKVDFRCEFDLPKFVDLTTVEGAQDAQHINFAKMVFSPQSDNKSGSDYEWFQHPRDFKLMTKQQHEDI